MVGFGACYHVLLLIFLLPGIHRRRKVPVWPFFSAVRRLFLRGRHSLEDAKARNSDVVAWLTVPATR